MKYPKKNKGRIKIPIKSVIDNKWYQKFLNKDGSYSEAPSICNFNKKNHCWVCCKAYNKNNGYSEKEVFKILKKYQDGKLQKIKLKEIKGKKEKRKKTKKCKKNIKKGSRKNKIKKSFFNN